MFDGLCTLAALFLSSKAREDYRDIAFFVLGFFVWSEFVYYYVLWDIRHTPGNGWIIYLLYSCVNVTIIIKIRNLMSAVFIKRVLIVNVLLNIVAAYYFISKFDLELFYTIYPYPAGLIMVLCLFYLWVVSYGLRLRHNKMDHSGVLGYIIHFCDGMLGRGKA